MSNLAASKDVVILGGGVLAAAEGDYMGVPIVREAANGAKTPVGLLGADTLTCNGNREAWQKTHPEPAPSARTMDDEEKAFLREIASILSAGFTRFAPAEKVDTDTEDGMADLAALEGQDLSMGKLMRTGLEALAKYLKGIEGVNAYVSVSDRSQDLLSVVYQIIGGEVYGRKGTDPGDEKRGKHSWMMGKQLASVNKPVSFGLFNDDSPSHLYCEDVSKADNVEVYGGEGSKQEDCLLVVGIGSGANQVPVAVLGVEAPSPPGLTQEQIDTIVKMTQMLSGHLGPVRTKNQKQGVCNQALQWLEATTGVQNVYISVPDEGDLRYISANKGNEFLLGKKLPVSEGISHEVWDAENGQIVIEDLKADAENNGKVKFFNADKKGQPGQCFFVGVKGEDGTPTCVLGCDTLGGKKTKVSQADMNVFIKSGALLADIFAEIAAGTFDELTDDVQLDIEKTVGPGGTRFYKKVLIDILHQLSGLTKDHLLEMARYSSPPELIVKVVSATLVVLQHKPKSVDQWDECRKHIKQPMLDKMTKFDATKGGKKRKNFFRRAKSMLKGLDMELVHAKGSLPASIFFQWSFVSIQLRYVADLLRKQTNSGILLNLDDPEEEANDDEHDGEDDDDDGDDDGDTTAGETTDEEEEE